MNYRTPGVYIEEIPKLPPSIAQVETAIPVFIGYTAQAIDARGQSLLRQPTRITSMLEYERYFGGPDAEKSLTVNIIQNPDRSFTVNGAVNNQNRSPYRMYYSLQWFFMNGGGPCFIVSVGDYSTQVVDQTALLAGLDETDRVDEITLILFPDAVNLSTAADYYGLYTEAIDKCVELQDRFAIMDVWENPADPTEDPIETLRNNTPNEVDRLKYAAAYWPPLMATINYNYSADLNDLSQGDTNVQITGFFNGTLAELKDANNALYFRAKSALSNIPLEMSPSSAMAGVYARVDNARGVWKAPANVSIDGVIEPKFRLTDADQRNLNVDDTSGKSINVIRFFTGRGPAISWGARTLAGNDNEWRYIPVRRLFIMVEESVKKATAQFVFEPNDANTWATVKAMIENFLTLQWRAGALQGATTEQAFYVHVGLGLTMTALDILEGRMIVEIGMAAVRPAEFIILRFSHKMAEA
ncbi:MAG: phage tail sheath family protein [Saprospirales bacterium]|nr:phage tail sheath family protein [Saprospirales bacterium]